MSFEPKSKAQAAQAPPKNASQAEFLLSARIIPLIGGALLMTGLVLFIRYALAHGALSPAACTALEMGCSGLMALLGAFLTRTERRYGLIVQAVGSLGIYVSVIAGVVAHRVIPGFLLWPGCLAVSLAIVAGGGASQWRPMIWLGAAGAMAGVFLPLAVGSGMPLPLLALVAAASVGAVHIWRRLTWEGPVSAAAALGLALICLAGWLGQPWLKEQACWTAASSLLLFILTDSRLPITASATAILRWTMTAGMVCLILAVLGPSGALPLAAALSGGLAGLAFLEKKDSREPLMALAIWTAVLALPLCIRDYGPAALAAAGLAAGLWPRTKARPWAYSLSLAALALGAGLFAWDHAYGAPGWTSWALLAACSGAMPVFLHRSGQSDWERWGLALLSVAVSVCAAWGCSGPEVDALRLLVLGTVVCLGLTGLGIWKKARPFVQASGFYYGVLLLMTCLTEGNGASWWLLAGCFAAGLLALIPALDSLADSTDEAPVWQFLGSALAALIGLRLTFLLHLESASPAVFLFLGCLALPAVWRKLDAFALSLLCAVSFAAIYRIMPDQNAVWTARCGPADMAGAGLLLAVIAAIVWMVRSDAKRTSLWRPAGAVLGWTFAGFLGAVIAPGHEATGVMSAWGLVGLCLFGLSAWLDDEALKWMGAAFLAAALWLEAGAHVRVPVPAASPILLSAALCAVPWAAGLWDGKKPAPAAATAVLLAGLAICCRLAVIAFQANLGLALSLVMGVYGLAVLAGGLFLADSSFRRASWGILLLAALKVAVWDAASMADGPRIIAFLSVGGILVAAGWLAVKTEFQSRPRQD